MMQIICTKLERGKKFIEKPPEDVRGAEHLYKFLTEEITEE
jgi:hypothetical protein